MGGKRKEKWLENALCHPDKKHKALGLCENCYAKVRRERRTPEERAEIAKKKRQYYMRCRRSKRWRDKQKDRGKYQRLKRYGLTTEDYQRMRQAQNERCACCGDSLLTAKGVHIDHNHKTGKVREILCDRCNFGIGQFSDDTERLRKAIEYLEKHKEKEGAPAIQPAVL